MHDNRNEPPDVSPTGDPSAVEYTPHVAVETRRGPAGHIHGGNAVLGSRRVQSWRDPAVPAAPGVPAAARGPGQHLEDQPHPRGRPRRQAP